MRELAPTLIPKKAPRGFALVIVLTLMVLLTVIAVGLLTLSSVTLRSSTQVQAMATARANARLALALAIGDLQKYAGPDQRITAPASILDSQPETATLENVGEPNVAGVWQASQQEAGKAPELPNYDKPAAFRRWLVSGLVEGSANRSDALSSSPFRNAESGVALVAENTTKDDNPASPSHLWAGKIKLSESGHGAYAVMDEGAKARINLTTAASGDERSRAAAGAPPFNAFDLVRESQNGQGASLEPYHGFRETAAKAITLESAPLLNSGLPALGPYSQDFTTDSAGVMSDVVLGGLRKDLSLFGELPKIPADYQKRRIYSDSDTPFANIPSTATFNGGAPDPHWNLIYDHLNLHKRVAGAGGPNLPTLTLGSSLPTGFRAGSGADTSFKINRDAQSVAPLAPVIVRCELMFSFFAKEARGHTPWEWEVPNAFGGGTEGSKWSHMLHLIYTPLVTLWNPYNITLKLRQPVVEIANPPVAFRFIRQKSSAASAMGEVTSRLVPLDEMFLNGAQKFDKKFVMQLFGQVGSSGGANGDVVLLPGEVKVFSPAQDPNWDFARVFDWQNNLTDRVGGSAQIRAAPGWRGPQYGFNIDWLAGEPSYVFSPRNGSSYSIGVIGSRIDDIWDVECGLSIPKRKDRSAIKRYAVSLLTANGATSAASTSNVLSRLEFDFNGDLAVLGKALTQSGTSPKSKIPFKMSEFSNPEKASNIRVGISDPLKKWIVKPFMVLTTQAKTTADSEFPARTFIHGGSSRPVSYQSLASDRQASNSHELALIQYKNGMATDAKIDIANRGFAFGGATPLQGSSFFIQRELAVTPIQSVAQIGHFDLAASGFGAGVDHAVGSSFAHPLIRSGEFRTGQAVDHAWLANFRLWDSWYASTYTNQRLNWPGTSNLKAVIDDFTASTRPLPNSRFSPWTMGLPDQAISGLLTSSGSEPQPDAFRRSAATQILNGAFNVNSTSKAAWMAVLAGLDRETISSLVFNGTAVTVASDGLTTSGPYFTRRRMPADGSGTTGLANPERFRFWNGGCELTRAELEALAEGIVREVKRRGPFLSLAEFVNRRIGPESDLTLKGAIQAAIDDAPGIGDLNLNSQGARRDAFADQSREITPAEIVNNAYLYPQAALGQTATGAGGSLDQLAVLNQIGSTITARSDTFRIRAYGDAIDSSGKVLARARCEAVLQRIPDYVLDKSLGGNEPWDTPSTAALDPINLTFGRRFEVRSFRWLAENEI